MLRPGFDIHYFNIRQAGTLPALLGITTLEIAEGLAVLRFNITLAHLSPNGFLHAASVIALADTAAGYATVAHLPAGAENFTTLELKANFLGTSKSGSIHAQARAVHMGRSTQVWDARVSDDTDRTIALFRCTQLILWPRPPLP